MAEDNFKSRGPLKSNQPDAGGASIYKVPVIGIVKDNIDPTRAGRIKVFISDKGIGDSDSSANWVSVGYLSSFFGKVGATASDTGTGSYKGNPSSYGQWQAPPDIGTKVLCIFVNGDPNYGFYIGSIPEAESLHMVPAIGSSEYVVPNEGEANSYGGAVRLPVTNINTNDKATADGEEFNNAPRPVHSYSAAIMNQQGIIRDPIRGPISSSAARENASRVGWGVSSPGRPIYEGGYDDSSLPANLLEDNPQGLKVVARRGGHSIVMDDGDIIGRDQLVRIRTALGHQILMSDDGQTLMILHSNGQSYVELGKEGTIDLYSTNSVNIRTQGDLNLHADRDVNIHAAEKFNVQAKNIHTNSEEVTQSRAGSNYKIAASGNFTGLAGGGIALGAAGDASLAGGGSAYINGSKVNLNSGSSSLSPSAVLNIPLVAQTDTLYDEEKGFMAAPGKLLSITSRTPAHAPWANAGQGVDIKTDLNASSQLPAAPSAATTAVNTAAAATGPIPPALATVASVPSAIPAVSAALDKATTGAVLGAQATDAANGALSKAVKTGAAIVNNAQETVLAVGSFAVSPKTLETAGIIKPGASTMINGLVDSGKNLVQSIPNTLFTGQAGAKNVLNLAQDVTSQSKAVVNTMQQAQNTLTKVGAITGKEASGQIAGLVNAASTMGVGATTAALQQISGKVANLSANAAKISGAIKAIGSGNVASLFGSISGALRGITTALSVMNKIPSLVGLIDQTRGIAGGAFSAIKNSFGKLKAGVPQNLTAAAKESAAISAGTSEQTVPVITAESVAGAASLDQVATSPSNNITVQSVIGAPSLDQVATSPSNNITLQSVSGAPSINQIDRLSTIAPAAPTVASNTRNNSISSVTGELTSAINNTQRLASNFNAIGSTVTNTVTTIGGVTGVSSSLSSVTRTVVQGTTAINTVLTGVRGATVAIGAASGASSALASGGIPALVPAAETVQRGAAASTSSLLASGINNLTGGINTAASVVNNAAFALSGIPGTGELTSAIRDATSTVMRGASLLNAASGLLSGKSNSLTAFASLGLPVGAIAQLQSAISSLSGGGSGIKLPTVGFNTVDRGAITSQIKSVIGDPGIPAPNLVGEIPESAKNDLQAVIDKAKAEQAAAKAKLAEASAKRDAARKAYEDAEKTLPQGDPELTRLLNASIDAEAAFLLANNIRQTPLRP